MENKIRMNESEFKSFIVEGAKMLIEAMNEYGYPSRSMETMKYAIDTDKLLTSMENIFDQEMDLENPEGSWTDDLPYEIPVEISYEVFGEHRSATYEDPEEYPDYTYKDFNYLQPEEIQKFGDKVPIINKMIEYYLEDKMGEIAEEYARKNGSY